MQSFIENAVEYPISRFPVIGGAYLLLLKGVVVYVGQARNVHARVLYHAGLPEEFYREKKTFDSVKIIEVSREDRDEVEQRLIAYYQPLHNGRYSKQACSRKFSECQA